MRPVLAATHAYALMLEYKEFPVLKNSFGASPISYYGRVQATLNHKDLTVTFQDQKSREERLGIVRLSFFLGTRRVWITDRL